MVFFLCLKSANCSSFEIVVEPSGTISITLDETQEKVCKGIKAHKGFNLPFEYKINFVADDPTTSTLTLIRAGPFDDEGFIDINLVFLATLVRDDDIIFSLYSMPEILSPLIQTLSLGGQEQKNIDELIEFLNVIETCPESFWGGGVKYLTKADVQSLCRNQDRRNIYGSREGSPVGSEEEDEFGGGGSSAKYQRRKKRRSHRKRTRKVRKKGTKKKARRRRIYKSKASKRFIDTFNIKKTKHKYPFTRGNLFYLNKKSHGKRITAKIIRKYPKAFKIT